MTIHAVTRRPDKLLPERVDPAKLASGDYLRDLGRFRLIASVTTPQGPVRTSRFLVRFADDLENDLGIPWGVDVTVWREP